MPLLFFPLVLLYSKHQDKPDHLPVPSGTNDFVSLLCKIIFLREQRHKLSHVPVFKDRRHRE